MRLDSTVADLLIRHIPKEESAAREYYARVAWAKDQGFIGSAARFAADAQEEHGHVRLLIDYALARGAALSFSAMSAPDQSFASLLDCYQTALMLEETVQQSLEAIARAARAAADEATVQALAPLLAAQVRSVDELTDVVRQLTRIGDDSGALVLWDSEQGETNG